MTKLLKDLPVGANVKEVDTRFNGREIIWIVADKNHRGYPENTVTLISERILTNRKFDNNSPVYKNSEIRRWINSPDGLSYNFSHKFKEAIVATNVNTKSGGSLSDSIFLASFDEVINTKSSYSEGYLLSIFSTYNRIAKDFSGKQTDWWLRTAQNPYNPYGIQLDGDYYYYSSTQAIGVRPLCNVKENIMVKDNPINGVYEITWNQPPSKPSSFSIPEKVISRSETEISWTKSTDPENDPISYRLERSLDGGDFVERYKGSFTRFKDTIEEKGHKAVVYRVTAIDSNGNQSPNLTSASIPVSDNTIPVIETTSADLGKITTAYSVSYKVVDPDEGQTWTVTESLDGKVLKTFTAKVGTSYTSKLSPSDWQKVLNGKHILKIEVVDSDGGKSAKEIRFEKAITKLDFMLDKTGVQGIDKMPERAILSMSANIPAGASIKVEITNNGLDDKPVWQDCTAQVLGNEKIFFSNKKKTATKWAVNVRVTGDKKTATDVLSVSIIGGFYD